MKITLVRHGRTYYNEEGRLQGHMDTELNEEGVEQGKRTALRLQNDSFDCIVSSGLQRTDVLGS